jgi:hypothetical protein
LAASRPEHPHTTNAAAITNLFTATHSSVATTLSTILAL